MIRAKQCTYVLKKKSRKNCWTNSGFSRNFGVARGHETRNGRRKAQRNPNRNQENVDLSFFFFYKVVVLSLSIIFSPNLCLLICMMKFVVSGLDKPLPTRTILMSNGSSSSSHLHLVGKRRHSGNERSGERRRDTKTDDRS